MSKIRLYLFLLGVLFGFSVPRAWSYEDLSNVVIEMNDIPDIAMTIASTEYGPIVVRGEGKFFASTFVNNTGDDLQCDFRFAAFTEDGQVVQIYSGIGYTNFQQDEDLYLRMPCLIDLPEGDYYFMPLVRIEGDSKWYSLKRWATIVKNGYWKLHVYENYQAPSCSHMYQQTAIENGNETPDCNYLVYTYKLGEAFKLKYELHNNTSNVLKGHIKVVYERNLSKFWRGMKYSSGDVTDEWADCITQKADINGLLADETSGIKISFEPGEKKEIIINNCFGTTYRDDGNRWSPIIAAYFLPDGCENKPENWLMIKEDCFDFLDGESIVLDKSANFTFNTQFFMFSAESVANGDINLNALSLKYSKSDGVVIIENAPLTSNICVYSLDGIVVDVFRVNSESISFQIEKGLYIVSIIDKYGNRVKSFKVLR